MTISFRYNVIGNLQTSEQERTYHAVAERISKGEFQTLSPILEALRPVYPADEPFRAAFADKAIGTTQARNNRIVRYILGKLERQETGADHDFESDAVSLEHVCPQNPQGGWSNFTDEELETSVFRLGNMTLLETTINRAVGNAQFTIKREAYLGSLYAITRGLAELNAEWTPARISARQASMAKVATAIWRVSQLA